MSKPDTIKPICTVIIPTYDRPVELQRTLQSLCTQKLHPSQYEVIVVEDGSSENLVNLQAMDYPFSITFLEQDKQGPTQARNLGAQNSRGEVLIFLDDDISISPYVLSVLKDECKELNTIRPTILMGTLVLPSEIIEKSSFARALNQPAPTSNQEVHFTFCKTGLLAVQRQDFFSIGSFQDPTGGWPNWDDVDFGYRANQIGYCFAQSARAVGEHWDYASINLEAACNRIYRASQSAARLFQVYPELRQEIPMFRDMLPLNPRQDGLLLTMRKIARKLISTPWLSIMMKQAVQPLEYLGVPRKLMRAFYTWILGGMIYQGLKSGQAQYGSILVASSVQNEQMN